MFGERYLYLFLLLFKDTLYFPRKQYKISQGQNALEQDTPVLVIRFLFFLSLY